MDEYIRVGDIIQYYYCPRKVYFIRTIEVPHSIRKKMIMGREEQEKEKRRVMERKTAFGISWDDVEDILFNHFVECSEISLCGSVDAVIMMKNDETIPVEIKWTDDTTIKFHWKKQLYAYALLLEKRYGKKVRRGVLYFPEQNEEKIITIDYREKIDVMRDIKKIKELIKSEKIPPKSDERKCGYCEMKKYCGA